MMNMRGNPARPSPATSRVGVASPLGVVLVLVSLSASLTYGEAAGTKPANIFESASVRLATGASGSRGIGIDTGGRLIARGVLLRDLIQFAYGLQALQRPTQIVGGPEWVHSDRFDIVATPPDTVSGRTASGPSEQLLSMLRRLLADRFKLTTHPETRKAPLYALRTDKPRRIVSGLRASTVACRQALYVSGDSGREDACGVRGAPGRLVGRGATMAQLASVLANFPAVARVVRDETGLAGPFDWQLAWTPAFVAGPTSQSIAPNPSASHGIPLETALREQLGLQLEPRDGPVPVIVIDRAERPVSD